jgi:hypothetical protein
MNMNIATYGITPIPVTPKNLKSSAAWPVLPW